jgi:hypothetical protein
MSVVLSSGFYVLVCKCCHNKITLSGWLKQHIFFHSFGGKSLETKVVAGLVSPETALLGLQMVMFFLCPRLASSLWMLILGVSPCLLKDTNPVCLGSNHYDFI